MTETERKAKRAAYMRAWRAKNPDRAREISQNGTRKWRHKPGSREKESAYQRKWMVANREHVRAHERQRRQIDLDYRIETNLRCRLNQAIRIGTRGGSAVRDLGCSIEFLRAYLQGQFEPSMSWDNWGKWHIDHIKPLASFDLSHREQFLQATHYTNLQPLWASDNLSKGARV